ncbi:dolichyl-phosphate-mannose--protein mannosyltransferase [Gryllotalpicola ginsengisoli]|uniref:dolichyl-phosphate-mannose--protein mannosyltransferase n=1 Tax=Gryllotalpicola ginsengisoli TaxID=444608 RepID=UPI001FE1F084|nr:phospholipid carrier-dependent glycosyltransferase [Gryllotalpicola ginsengisoli]
MIQADATAAPARRRIPMSRRRLWDWGAPAGVVVIAALLRLVGLGSIHQLIFDETYYVKDAWTLSQLGYEGSWGSGADSSFNQGITETWTRAAEFVAHPPLGKWLIALGEHLFGITDAFGWRFSTAVAGVLAVVLVMLIAKRLFHGSTLLAVISGLLMAIDGNAIVLSRVALLDNFVMLFALAGVGAVLLDRDWRDRRAARGMVLWRPWLLVAGLLFGLDAGIKWSGFYFLAVFGVYVVLCDVMAYRRKWREPGAGHPFTVLGQGVVNFVQLVPIALAAYLATWTGWLVTDGGWDRHWVESDPKLNAWHGALSWVPYWVQNLWHYHTELYNYSINLHATHPYQSNPLGWILMLRPTSMYYVGTQDGQDGCTASGGCSAAITELGNPFIWWAMALALLWLIWLFARYRDRRAGLLLAGVGAGWLPWVILYHGRTIFTFYSIAFEPYLILGLTLALGQILRRWRGARGIAVVGGFLLLACAATVFFLPIWTGIQTSYAYWHAHMWLDSWI